MAYLNDCKFIGNVGKAPEIRVTAGGKKVAKLSIAVSKKVNGNDSTEWISLVAWEKKAELVERFVGKGDPIFVSCEFHLRTWDDPNGGRKSSPEFNVLDIQLIKKREAGSGSQGGGYGSSGGYGSGMENPSYGGQNDANPDDDLPF